MTDGSRELVIGRKPQRLPEFDYSSEGAYFVTICVKDMKQVLGEVAGEGVELSDLRKIVKKEWGSLPSHYENIRLDEFVVMPNHFHGIVWITGPMTSQEAVGAGLKPAPTQHGLSEIVRGFKTYSARKINKLSFSTGQPFWQRVFYEHIVRDEVDLKNHRQYIIDNPIKWELDKYYA